MEKKSKKGKGQVKKSAPKNEEAVQAPRHVVIREDYLREAWALINTREWPFSMFGSLATVKQAFETAVIEASGENKDKVG